MILELTAEDLEAHYAKNPKEADALIRFGESKPDPGIGAQKLAAWTMLANQMLNLDEVSEQMTPLPRTKIVLLKGFVPQPALLRSENLPAEQARRSPKAARSSCASLENS